MTKMQNIYDSWKFVVSVQFFLKKSFLGFVLLIDLFKFNLKLKVIYLVDMVCCLVVVCQCDTKQLLPMLFCLEVIDWCCG
jgi:hypothetical protein